MLRAWIARLMRRILKIPRFKRRLQLRLATVYLERKRFGGSYGRKDKMRRVKVEQNSEAWETYRKVRATASNFARIITPKQLKPSAQRVRYADEIVCARLGIDEPPPPPTYHQQRGSESEPFAFDDYMIENKLSDMDVERVGFCVPDETDRYGCSPDLMVGKDGLLECKALCSEVMLKVHRELVCHGDTDQKDDYKMQIQGQLLVTGRDWCDLYMWHPELAPVTIRIERCEKTLTALREGLEQFCDELDVLEEQMKSKLRGRLDGRPF